MKLATLAALSLAASAALAGSTVPAALPAAAAAAPLPANVALTQRTTTSGRGDSTVATPTLQGLSGLARPVSAAILSDLTNQAKLLTNAAKAPHVSVTVAVYLAEQDENYVSFHFETSTYSAGAAHPLSAPTTVSYARGTGRRVGFADLFKGHEPAALAALSKQTRALLPTLLGVPANDPDVLDGTKPTLANLGTVTPRVTGVEVVFSPYQVAAYADGEPSVIVPWSALKDLVALPLPATVEPAPPYLGGYPTVVDASLGNDVAKAISGTTNATVKARAKGGYRLTDAVIFASTDGSSTTYELVRLVPVTAPATAITVALVDHGKGLSVVDAQTGAAGCRTFPTLVQRRIRSGCK